MVRQLLPVAALLFGSALLLFGGGMHGLILAVRGSAEGFSASSLGLLGTGWAIGYVLGCIFAPRIVGAVGHVRAFGALCAFAGVAILVQALAVSPQVWIPVRGLSGFCFAGAAMIVESWLNDRAQPSTRGRIFGIDSMVNLGAITLGQMAISLGDVTDFTFFAIGAISAHAALILFALWRISRRPAPEAVKNSFHVAVPVRAVTPETVVLAEGEDESLPLVVEKESVSEDDKTAPQGEDSAAPDNNDKGNR